MYPRRPGQSQSDRERARRLEDQVAAWIGSFKIDQTSSPDKLDFWVPGLFIEVKAKFQHIGDRWPLPEGCKERDAFILDELSVRKALAHFPAAYVVFFDEVGNRKFFARIDEVACAEHTRVNRVGSTGVAKGKHIYDLRHFRPLADGEQLIHLLLADQVALGWRVSHCISELEVASA